MKVKVQQESLVNALKKVSKALNSKSMPILQGVKISSLVNDRLSLRGTDLSVDIESVINSDNIEEGEVVVPGDIFRKYISKLPEGEVEIEADEDNMIYIKCNGADTEMSGWDAEEFPTPDKFDDDEIEFEQNRLKEILEKTRFATSDDESKPFLNGVLLDENNAAATDTFKLSGIKHKLNIRDELILPNVTIDALTGILGEGQGSMSYNDSMIRFDLGHTIIYSRTIEGDFPDYQQVIPKQHQTKAIVNTDKLKGALERASLLTDDNNIVVIETDEEDVELSISKGEKGKTTEKLENFFSSECLQIAFNAKYLLSMIKQTDSEKLELKLQGSMQPLKVQEEGNSQWVVVVMPIRQPN